MGKSTIFINYEHFYSLLKRNKKSLKQIIFNDFSMQKSNIGIKFKTMPDFISSLNQLEYVQLDFTNDLGEIIFYIFSNFFSHFISLKII